MKKVVLFDFHNTLATCDCWLELEIKTLPALVLTELASKGVIGAVSPHMKEEAIQAFQALRQEVRKSGVELSAFEGARRVLLGMGVAAPDSEVEQAVVRLENACLPSVEIVAGAGEALEQLRGAGCIMAVVSSAGFPPFVEMALEKLALRTYFSEVVTSAGEGIYKSDPTIFRRAVERLHAKPGDGVHIGDHPVYDVQTARAAGLSTIWFREQAQRTSRLHGNAWEEAQEAGSGADAIVDSMSDLYAAVEAL